MIKAIPVMAVLAAMSAAPALAQARYEPYPSDNTTTTQPQLRDQDDQQARTPESEEKSTGEVETLRQRGMSAPNVTGDEVPENPATGVPEPQARDHPKQLESIPRP